MRKIVVVPVLVALLTVPAVAQSSFTPSYNAPYRAFQTHEFGGTLSFPGGTPDFAVEGQYRFGVRRVDLGLRFGFVNTEVGGAMSTMSFLGSRAVGESSSIPSSSRWTGPSSLGWVHSLAIPGSPRWQASPWDVASIAEAGLVLLCTASPPSSPRQWIHRLAPIQTCNSASASAPMSASAAPSIYG